MGFIAGILIGIGLGVVISVLFALWVGYRIYDQQQPFAEDWQIMQAEHEQNYHLN